MNEDDISQHVEPEQQNCLPLWSPKSILWIGALSSFLFAGYIQSANFGRLNQPKQKSKILIRTTFGFIAFIVCAYKTPDTPLYSLAFWCANIWISYWISLLHQDEYKKWISTGGSKASLLKPIVGTVFGTALLSTAIFGWAYYEVSIYEEQFDAGLSFLESGRYTEAEKAFVRYLKEYPDEPDAYWNLAIIYEENDQVDKAIFQVEKYLELKPWDEDAKIYLLELVENKQVGLHDLIIKDGVMSIDNFWGIINKVEYSEEPEVEIVQILNSLSSNDLVLYQSYFDSLHEKAYRWDLWGAAYIIEGGCSDDGFIDFRYGLISKGQDVYERAIANPDTLAKLGREMLIPNELFGYVALEVYEEKTGNEMPRKKYEQAEDPIGDMWDFDDEDENAKRLPKLANLYSS